MVNFTWQGQAHNLVLEEQLIVPREQHTYKGMLMPLPECRERRNVQHTPRSDQR